MLLALVTDELVAAALVVDALVAAALVDLALLALAVVVFLAAVEVEVAAPVLTPGMSIF